MNDTTQNLIEEILSLKSQYQEEVSSHHKPWPKSIKARVLELVDHGLRPHEISQLTQLSYHTLYRWGVRRSSVAKDKKKIKTFHPLTVTEKDLNPPLVKKTCTVTEKENLRLITPDGYCLEFTYLPTMVSALQILRRGN